jgi:hypothetical protein
LDSRLDLLFLPSGIGKQVKGKKSVLSETTQLME